MKNLLVITVLVLSLTSFQVKAQQCCPTSKSQTIMEASINQQTTNTVKFKIDGITCAGCSNAIYNALKEVEGVVEHSVEYPGDIAIIKFENTKTNIEALKKIIENKGYKVEKVMETTQNEL
jgi:copper chaperone CopZ